LLQPPAPAAAASRPPRRAATPLSASPPLCLQVLRALINRVPRTEPAAIHGYQRYRIKGQVFPGAIKVPAVAGTEAQVKGLVLFDLQLDELEVRRTGLWPSQAARHQQGQPQGQIQTFACSSTCHHTCAPSPAPSSLLPQVLDEFEGEEYFKQPVEARLDSPPGGSCSTHVYLWQDSLHSYLYGEWDPQEFRQQQLGSYVEMCARFAANIKQQRDWKGSFVASSSSEEEGAAEGVKAARGSAEA
jgi:hypothetical protein